ncbi:hypothetical protein SLEP1_g2527 [Rubroshorea leprosula]|uniref:AAA+ ATPase domain-containing protein n=1 Tax=Rubroshorea leprosula TaxID=152421 RepID=A0AAV5HLV6_9ROSI|nr:hypothetical protein SLEP1_g2527 [Rubroshorea leprosula]
MAEAFGIAVAENAAGTVAGSWIDRSLKRILNPIILVVNWKANVENLKKQVAELKEEVQRVEHQTQAAERRGEEIEQMLKTWLTKTSKFIEAENTVEDDEEKPRKKCFFGICINPLSRYRLSKQSVEDSKDVADLLRKACGFNLPISYYPIPQQEVAAPVKGFQDFDSRMKVLDEIMEALKSPNINGIGVHGMPGVGKTMLLKEVKRKAEQEKLFDVVVMAPVTEHPDLRKIQDEIAYGLGLELPAGIGDRSIAVRIKERILKKRKVLVVLDDLWDRLDLEAVGIPFEDQQKEIVEPSSSSAKDQQKEIVETSSSSAKDQQMECKILLSSRLLNVLTDKMVTHKKVAVGQLEDQEAWQMFKKIVGDRPESSELQPTGIEIVRRCGGLPVAIAALAEALKNKSSYKWRSALQKLRDPSPSNCTGIHAGVHAAIEISYNHLGSQDLKQAFLLSSLMGRNVSIQDLLKYGLGLGIFSQAYTIEEARYEVLTLISNLKDSSLLMDGSNSERFGMHDIIRSVAISIACRDRHVLFSTGDHVPKWSDKEAMKDFKWISLEYANVNELPDELESPQLTLFCLCNEGHSLGIPANFFKGMQSLKVLDLTSVNMSSMPPSICLLKNLHTLCLDQSLLGDIAIIGELKNLEVLSLLKSDIEKLPREIGQLTKLKLLDLSNCIKLKVIPPGVLACLSRLEELYLGSSFDRWEHEEHENQENASVAELKHLKELTALEVRIPDAQMIPIGLFSEKLTRHKIFLGYEWNNWTSSFESSRIVKLQLKAYINFDYSIKRMLKMTEELHLEELNGVNNVVDEFNSEGFKHLKYLDVRNAAEVQQIVKSEEGVPFNAFSSLENLFSCSVAQQLLQLRRITATDCSNMEEIVDNEEEGNGNAIVEATEGVQWKFGGLLRSLRLQNLAKLTHFNRGCRGMILFSDQVAFPNLEELHLSEINVNKIWQASITPSSIENLTKLIIQGCHNLGYLFSFSMIRCLVKLGHLEIKECKGMGEIIVRDNAEEREKMVLPQLNFLLMKDLQSLVRFYSGNCVVEFPSLKQLDIRNCPEFKGFTVKSTSTDAATDIEPLFNEQVAFLSLERLSITHLKNLTTIWQDQLHVDSFCKLKSLEVRFCVKLVTVLPSNNMLGNLWTSLEELIIDGCSSLEAIFKIGEFNATRTLVATDTQLRVLHIENLPRLKHVWDKDPKRILTFHNLESVFVDSCWSLYHLFPSSVAKYLLQLQKLVISRSGLKEIVAMGTGTEAVVKFEFPQVSSLVLWNLTSLRYFYPEKHIIEWPMLKKFYYFDCGQVEKRNGQEQDYELDFPVQQPLLCMKKVIPQLEELSLSERDISGLCGECQFKQNLFFNIKLLYIQNYFDDESDGFPMRFLHKFSNLEKLVFTDCHLTELFPSKDQVEEQEKHGETLSRIRELELDGIDTLRHISTSKIASFQNLTYLRVQECHTSLITLLSVSIARSLVQLERMIVTECNSLSKIVGSEGDGIDDSIINFSKLRFLELECLQRLERFCLGNFNLKFPSLEKVIVHQCPRLKIFSERDLDTPLLRKVELVEGEDKGIWAGDLNTTIQRMYKEKVGLKNLTLSDFPELMEIWHIKSPQEISLDWRLLLNLQIYDCSNFTYLLTPSMVLCLVQLRTIQVKCCAMMEQVIMGDEESKMIFPQLQFIMLQSCSNLTTFCGGSYNSLEIPALTDIIVEDCPKMVTFTSTSFREHRKEASQYYFSSKVEFPNLKSLKLSSLNINQIWNKNHEEISSFKKLQHLEVCNCSNLSYLLTPSMALGLVQLKDLEVKDCATMEQVIMAARVEEKIIVKNCLKRVRFASKFLSDKEKEIAEGRNEEVHVKEEPDVFIEAFFCDEVELPILETLTLSSINVKQIWNSQLSSISSFVQHLTKLNVVNCSNLKYMFTFSMVKSFVQLEELRISGCEMVEVVILIEEMVEEEKICQTVFPKLYALVLNDLPQLATLCSNCDSLGKISDSERVNFGSGSQKLLATQSTLVETEATKLLFSQVTHLMLRLLPKFKGFFPQMHITEWPSLKSLVVIECHGAQIVASEFSSIEMTRRDSQLERESQHLIFWISKATFPSLERLVVKWNDNIKIQCGHHPEEYFGKLKVLHLLGFPKQSAFLLPFFFHSLPNLEELHVKDAFFDEILQCEEVTGEEKPVCGRTPLSKLRLSKLHELTHIWKEESQLEVDILRNLKTLKVQECSRLKNLVPSTVYFDNLQTLVVSECHGLVNLVRYSTAKGLGQLRIMKVDNCEMIEEIIVCLGDAVKDGIVFTKLNCLQLKGLPRLESFSSRDCNFKFPALTEVIITECPNMQIFSKGELSTPRLYEVKLTGHIYEYMDEDIEEDIEKKVDDIFNKDGGGVKVVRDRDERCWVGNLNSTVQQLFKEKHAHSSKKSNGEKSDHSAQEDGN